MLSFMDLPREIRDMVYGSALCVDGNLAPYKEGYHVPDDYCGPAPALSLLGVSRKIRDEALPVLYGKNTWLITSGAPAYFKREYTEHLLNKLPEEPVFIRFGHLMRSIVIDYSFQEVSSKDRTADVEFCHEPRNSMDHEARQQELHYLGIKDSYESWCSKDNYLKSMTNLASVVIDIKNLYCPLGCCRTNIVRHLLGQYPGAISNHPALKTSEVTIRGAKDSIGRDIVNDWHRQRMR